jgi:type I restriction enzyme, S subunit
VSQTVLLGDLIEDIAMGPFGSNLKTDNFIKSGVPVIRGGNLYEAKVGGNFVFVSEEKARSLKRSLAYPDDIVITHRGTLGQVSIVPKDQYPYYLASQSQLRFTPNKNKVDPKYLLYYLRSNLGQHELMQHTSQVGVPSIASPTKAVKSFKVILPDRAEQTKIASTLSTIDEKIELNQQVNKTLEQIGQALFRLYFVDNTDAQNWEVTQLKDVARYISRGISPKYDDTGSSIVVNQRCIRNGRFSITNARRQSKLFGSEKQLITGDVLINSTGVGTLGRVAQVDDVAVNTTFDSHVTVVRPSSSINIFFFGEMMRNLESTFENMGRGTTGQTELSRKSIEELKFKLPPNEIIDKFGEVLAPLRHQMSVHDDEIWTLTNIRDLVLPRLISGKTPI